MAVAPERPHEVATSLASWLARRMRTEGKDATGDVQVVLHRTPESGNSNVTIPLTATWTGPDGPERRALVLRMQDRANRIFLDPDVLREAAVLSGLAAWPDVPAPRVALVEPDPEVLGHPFFLMERVVGVVPYGKPSMHVAGWLPGLPPARRRTVWESALGALAAIHAVDWRVRHRPLADGPHGTTLAQRLDHLTRWYTWVRGGRPFPTTDAGLDHLQANLPHNTGPPVLCWGDARIGNMMFREDGSCAAVLDWELASIGPAALDLGWWLVMEEFQTSAHGVAELPGWPHRASAVTRYEQLSGTAVPDLAWYEVLATWILTVTVIRMADIGIAQGTLPPGSRMGHGNLTAQMLARRLGVPPPRLDPDYARRRGLPVEPPT